MDANQCYKLTRTDAHLGSVTNLDWGVGGMQSSTNGYQTYTISVYKHWYVYRRKPSWFGQYPHDRYLGKLRWISNHADGKQWRNISQHGSINGWVVDPGTSDASAKLAGALTRTYGYTQSYATSADLRQRRVERDCYKGIRCVACGITNAEVERQRYRMSFNLAWPKADGFRRGMDSWDARQTARETITCQCPHTPDRVAIDTAVRTGEPIQY